MINFDNVCRIYDLILKIRSETAALDESLKKINSDNCYMISENVYKLQEIAYRTALGGDERLIDDFEYLLYEVLLMKDGGVIRLNGKKYAIKTFEDLKNYWIEYEGLE